MKENSPLRVNRFSPALRSAAPAPIPDADPVFAVGDMVMHPAEGICSVAEVGSIQFSGTQSRRYYVLKPSMEKSSATVYLPVSRGNTILRRLLSREDILAIIHSSRQIPSLWLADSKHRKEAFSHILSEGNYARIIRMIGDIREHSALREQEGRRACAADEAILDEAERLLHQEFSYVLRLSVEDTVAFIMRELNIT